MRENTGDNVSRRKVVKMCGAGVSGACGLYAINGSTAAQTSSDNYQVELTGVSEDEKQTPNNQSDKVYLHKSVLRYMGMAPRIDQNQWAHVFRLCGRGTSGAYSVQPGGWWGSYSDTPEPFSNYIGHAIDISGWNATVYQPNENNSETSDLGASPADGGSFDGIERATNMLEAIAGIPSTTISTASAMRTIAEEMAYHPNNYSGEDTYRWELTELFGYNTQETSDVNHFVEFEVRAYPGQTIGGTVQSKSLADSLDSAFSQGLEFEIDGIYTPNLAVNQDLSTLSDVDAYDVVGLNSLYEPTFVQYVNNSQATFTVSPVDFTMNADSGSDGGSGGSGSGWW